MRAHAALAVERAGGRDRLAVARSSPPLTLRRTPGAVHLVASGAGPLGGDELRLDVSVGPGASLEVRSAAASLAQPGPGGGPSHLATTAEVGTGGELRWLPEPTVAVRGCDHRVDVDVALGPGARLLWREELVLGRHGEEPGSVLARLRVDAAGRPLLRTDLALGPRWPGSLGPAGVAGAGAVAAVLVVGPAADRLPGPAGPGVRGALLALGPGAVLATAVAGRAGPLRRAVDGWVAAALAGGASGPASPRRSWAGNGAETRPL